MPKKTRQEKILAQLKRLQQIQNVPTSNLERQGSSVQPKSVSAPALKSLESKDNTTLQLNTTKSTDYSYAYRDLRKTLIFVSVAIVFEIILSRII